MSYKKTGTGTVGTTYDSANGGYQKLEYLIPPHYWYAKQLKVIIANSQDKAFAELETLCGITLPRSNDGITNTYINPNSIFVGFRKADSNRSSLFIGARDDDKIATNYATGQLYLDVYVVPGKDIEEFEYSSTFLQGIENILKSFDPQELVDGWPANITDADTEKARHKRSRYAPKVIRDAQVITKDADRNARQIQTLGAVGCLTCNFRLEFKPNTLVYPLS